MVSSSITLTTPRLTLRAARHGDVDDIYRHLADWDVVSMLATQPWPFARVDAIRYVQRAAGHVIVHDGLVIGGIGIGPRACGAAWNDGDTGQPAYLGYWLGKAYWGQGFAREAALAVIARYFDDTEHDRLMSALLKDNTASMRLQTALGFHTVHEGFDFIVSRRMQVANITTELTRDAFERHRK